jgi:hypothetical protein
MGRYTSETIGLSFLGYQNRRLAKCNPRILTFPGGQLDQCRREILFETTAIFPATTTTNGAYSLLLGGSCYISP